MLSTIYEEQVRNKNPYYIREEILKSITVAMKRMDSYFSLMSSEELEATLKEYINSANGIAIFETTGIYFAKIEGVVYCFSINKNFSSIINEIALENSIAEYTLVSSVSSFLEKQMQKSLFSLLLRDYDTLNYVPEEYQTIKKHIINS